MNETLKEILNTLNALNDGKEITIFSLPAARTWWLIRIQTRYVRTTRLHQ